MSWGSDLQLSMKYTLQGAKKGNTPVSLKSSQETISPGKKQQPSPELLWRTSKIVLIGLVSWFSLLPSTKQHPNNADGN